MIARPPHELLTLAETARMLGRPYEWTRRRVARWDEESGGRIVLETGSMTARRRSIAVKRTALLVHLAMVDLAEQDEALASEIEVLRERVDAGDRRAEVYERIARELGLALASHGGRLRALEAAPAGQGPGVVKAGEKGVRKRRRAAA